MKVNTGLVKREARKDDVWPLFRYDVRKRVSRQHGAILHVARSGPGKGRESVRSAEERAEAVLFSEENNTGPLSCSIDSLVDETSVAKLLNDLFAPDGFPPQVQF